MDSKGLLIQQKSDGTKINCIDSMFLTGNTMYQKALTGSVVWFDGKPIVEVFNNAKEAYRADEGVHRRYWHTGKAGANYKSPDEVPLYTNPNTLSRDNHIGYLILLGYMGNKSEVRKVAENIIKRGSFFQNKITNKGVKKPFADFCGPSQWSILARAMFNKTDLHTFILPLLILDFFFMLSILVHVLKSWYDPTYASTVYHEVSALVQAKVTIETPFTKIATFLMFKCRRGVKEFPDKSPVVSALKYYSRGKYDPPIYEVTEELIKKVIDK